MKMTEKKERTKSNKNLTFIRDGKKSYVYVMDGKKDAGIKGNSWRKDIGKKEKQ